MKINVIGMGYIGLPTALMLATHGIEVIGTDYNKQLIETLNKGSMTFEEDGIVGLFKSGLISGIQFTTEYQCTDMYIVSVPTPYDKISKKIDTQYINKAVDNILHVCPKGSIIVIESTISPGTIDKFVRPSITKRGFKIGQDIHLAHAPERIIPGNMVQELIHNSRVIGADSREVGECVKKIYSSFCRGDIVTTDIKTAEMSKVVENTYRDINIAFANELAKICHEADIDVYKIIQIANMHPRVNILQPGPGVGGHCISVDPWFLVGDYPGLANLILTARKTNDSMPEYVLERIGDIMGENGIKDVSSVGLYGLTYKEDVDDVRESPTLQLLALMKKHLATGIKIYDPMVKKNIVQNQYHDLDQFLEEVDIVVIMVGHSQLRNNPEKLKGKIVLDARNVLTGESFMHKYAL